MSERYSKLFSLAENLYSEGAPVIIKAGALLKDNETGNLIAQLKISNITQKAVKLVKVKLICYDSMERPVGEAVTHQYLDITAYRDNDFGSQSPIRIPYKETRSYSVSVVEVGFAGGVIWTGEGEWNPIPKSASISILVSNNYALNSYRAKFGQGANYAIREHLDLWVCTCGAINSNQEQVCHKCRADLNELKTVDPEALKKDGTYSAATNLFASTTIENLKEAIVLFGNISDYRDSSEYIEKCKTRIAELEEKKVMSRKKGKKIAVLASIITVGVLLLGVLGYFVGYPLITCAIGDYSVMVNMYNLKEFDVPNGTVEIKEAAFRGCVNIENITLPNSVTRIGFAAFENCENLKGITIPNNVTTIDMQAFQYCDSIESIQIPDSVTSIGSCAFRYCDELENVSLGSGLTIISDEAFSGCKKLRRITIPKNATRMSDDVFDYCSSLCEITVEDGNTSYKSVDGVLYSKDGSKLIKYPPQKSDTEFTVPNGVKTIVGAAFYSSLNLRTVTIGETVQTIEYLAFCGCDNLENVSITGNITEVGTRAFDISNEKTDLKVYIGKNVTGIHDEAFNIWNTTIFYEGSKEQWEKLGLPPYLNVNYNQ